LKNIKFAAMRRRIDQGRANDSDILTASFTIACEIYHYHGLYAKNDTDYPDNDARDGGGAPIARSSRVAGRKPGRTGGNRV
jgi:hypothetical protein